MTRFFWLALVFVATRNHAWTPVLHLPDASLAMFFLAGLWSRSYLPLLGLLALGAAVDAWAVGMNGVSAYCITPAYAMLLPASATLWWAGRLSGSFALKQGIAWLPTTGVVTLAALLSELWSSGGFYFLGGRFPHPSLAGFLPRLWHYSPSVVGATLCYVVLGLLIERRFGFLHDQALAVPLSSR